MWMGARAGSHSQTRLNGLPHRWVSLKTGLCLRQGAANQQADQSQGDDLGRERERGTAEAGIGHRSRPLQACQPPHLVPACSGQGVSGDVERQDVGCQLLSPVDGLQQGLLAVGFRPSRQLLQEGRREGKGREGGREGERKEVIRPSS